MKKILILTFLFLILLFPKNDVKAIKCGTLETGIIPKCGEISEEGKVGRSCNWCDFFQLFINIICFLIFGIAPFLAVLFLSWAGFILIAYHFWPGETTEEALSKAKRIIITVIFALIFMYGAYFIVDLFFKIFTTFGENWSKLKCQ